MKSGFRIPCRAVHRRGLLAVLLLALGLIAGGCTSGDPAAADLKPSDLTLEEIVEKYAQALGGREAIQAVRTVEKRGHLTNRGPQVFDNVPIHVQIARPVHYRRQIDFAADDTSIQTIDGDFAWQIFPQAGIREPREMPGPDSNRFRRRIDTEGELLDWDTKGHTAELLGKGKTAGREVYAISIAFADGELTTLYLDAATFLPFREYERTLTARGWFEAEITYDDYREVDGVLWPYSEVTRLSVADVVQTLIWDTIETGGDFAPDVFTMPRREG